MITPTILLLGLGAAVAPMNVDWSKIGGGGGASQGGGYSITGTIGQADAGTMADGGYSLTGGFWGIAATAETPGVPRLTVALSPQNTVIVSWPVFGEVWHLQAASSLVAPVSWQDVPSASFTSDGGLLLFTEPLPQGNRFFRLRRAP